MRVLARKMTHLTGKEPEDGRYHHSRPAATCGLTLYAKSAIISVLLWRINTMKRCSDESQGADEAWGRSTSTFTTMEDNIMKKRVTAIALIAILVIGIFALAGCGSKESGGGDAAPAEEGGTFVVGLDDTFAPMGFRDESGEIVGFDIDMATAVAEKLGMTPEFKPIDWDAKEMELNSGNISCIWNGLSITPERMENMALSNKYLNNQIVVMALKDSDVDVKSTEDLANLKVGTQVDTSAVTLMEADPNYELFKDNISEYDTYDLAIMDLKAGRLDVIVVDQVLGEYTNNNLGGEMKECSFAFGDDYYVIGFKKDNTELRDKVNEALKALIDDGTAAEISEKWFGKNIVVFEPIE